MSHDHNGQQSESLEAEKAWTSAYITALPDSAFACVDSKGRHYPHHNSSGAVDLPHLRNALARLGDPSNTSCGASHIRAHARKAGIGREEKMDAPDITRSEFPEFTIPAVLTVFLTKEDDDGKKRRYFQSTASSTLRDNHDDEFTTKAVEKMARTASGSSMSIWLNHEYRIPEDLFGTTTDAVAVDRQADDGQMVKDLDLRGFVNEANPRARETADALEGGAKLGISIGARVKSYRPRNAKNPMGGWIIDDVELKEASIVGMPAQPRAWVHYATKAIRAFERARVKEAADMSMNATAVADPVVDEGFIEDAEETLALLDAVKVFTTESIPGEADPEPEPDPDVEVEVEVDDEEDEPASPEVGSPTDVTASETPADALSLAVANSAETLSVDAMKSALRVATGEIEKRDETIRQLEQERDVALATLSTATAIVERIASMPLGRKASFAANIDDYRARIGGVYSDEVIKFLKGSTPQ